MLDALDIDEKLEAPPTAADAVAALEVIEFVWRHDPASRDRARRFAKLLQPIIANLLRPKFIFVRDGEAWILGPEHEPRPYREKLKGLDFAHQAISRRFVSYEEIGSSQTAADNAKQRAVKWMRARCPALADAVASIKATESGLRYDPSDGGVSIITRS